MVFKEFYRLTKPGIIYGNLITSSAGFFLASQGNVKLFLFFSLVCGTALVIASGCIFNNLIDRDIDRVMSRTKNRPLIKKTIHPKAAFLLATLFGLIGFLILFTFTNFLTFTAGVIGYIFYLGIYSYSKRFTSFATFFGSISGAIPPVAGYLSVRNFVDIVALLLFLTLVFWQMAHFYAIAIYRLEDYKTAKIPVWPAVKSVFSTKIQIIFFSVAFGISASFLTLTNHASWFFFLTMSSVVVFWLKQALEGFNVKNEKNWARRFFLISQIVIFAFSVLISIDAFLFQKS